MAKYLLKKQVVKESASAARLGYGYPFKWDKWVTIGTFDDPTEAINTGGQYYMETTKKFVEYSVWYCGKRIR